MPDQLVQSKQSDKDYAAQAATIDITGKYITPFGSYEEVEALQNGYFQAAGFAMIQANTIRRK